MFLYACFFLEELKNTGGFLHSVSVGRYDGSLSLFLCVYLSFSLLDPPLFLAAL